MFRAQMVFDGQTGNYACIYALDPMQPSIKATTRKTQPIKMCTEADQNASKNHRRVASSCAAELARVNADV